MIISDIVLYVNSNIDIIYSDEQLLIDSFNAIEINNNIFDNAIDNIKNIKLDKIEYINQEYTINSIIIENNDTYISFINEYSSYIIGKIIYGDKNISNNKVIIKAYTKTNDGYHLYIDEVI